MEPASPDPGPPPPPGEMDSQTPLAATAAAATAAGMATAEAEAVAMDVEVEAEAEAAASSTSGPEQQQQQQQQQQQEEAEGRSPSPIGTGEEDTAAAAPDDGGGSSQQPAPAQAPAPPGPRPPLRGTLIGPFVVLDPARQSERLNNLRVELQRLGVHQRDVGNDDELQLSLEQAFYLVEECKRLEITLPEQQERPLGLLECWRAFAAASPTFVRSVGSYRHFRRQGFTVHGGLNLGLDYMLYRGSPQRYHAEFGVFLRYPPGAFAGQGEGQGGGPEGETEEPLTWRDLHLLYRLIGEVRKTLIVAHVRLGSEDAAPSTDGDAAAAAAPAAAAAAAAPAEETVDDEGTRREMGRWYWGLTLYEVAVTPWRAGTPLARPSKARGEEVQHKNKGRPLGHGGNGGGAGGGGGVGDGGPPCKRARVGDAAGGGE